MLSKPQQQILHNTSTYLFKSRPNNKLNASENGAAPRSIERNNKHLGVVIDTAFQRGGARGLESSFETGLYTDEEREALLNLRHTSQDIEKRMPVKISKHYAELARTSQALTNLVTANIGETVNLEGDLDPSNQLFYSPIKGLLHKYNEVCLLYASDTCSAHCRYCYRLDLFTKKTHKYLANAEEVGSYIRAFNSGQFTNGYNSNDTTYEHSNGSKDSNNGSNHSNGSKHDNGSKNIEKDRNKITEAILSGGDPMVLSNSVLANFMFELAGAGIRTIRIGTKELAFFPERFDENFSKLLDQFHKRYPNVHLAFMTHFSHPDEFLLRDEHNNYTSDKINGVLKWLDVTERAIHMLTSKGSWISLNNQTPIIRGVNDHSNILHILQRELFHKGIHGHYFFQCRHIEGHKHFSLTIENCFQIVQDSRKNLSGLERQAPLAMSTEAGKLEIVGISDDLIIFRLVRSPDPNKNGRLILAKRNPDALWIDDYDGFILENGDEANVFPHLKKEKILATCGSYH